MPAYTTPGVYVSEATLANINTTTISGPAAVFFGTAQRGPTEATLITDWPTYVATYGPLQNAYDLGYAVYHYFANGGRGCYVVRVVSGAAGDPDGDPADTGSDGVPFYPRGYTATDLTSTVSSSELTDNVATITANSHGFAVGDSVSITGLVTNSVLNVTDSVITAVTENTFSFALTNANVASAAESGTATVTAASRKSKAFGLAAVSVGSWPNTSADGSTGLVAKVVAGSALPSTTSHGSFTLTLTLDGKEVERWVDLSLDPDDSRYISSIVNNYSKYVTVDTVSVAGATALTDWNNNDETLTVSFVGGDDGDAIDGEDYTTAYGKISGIPGNLILNAVGQADSSIVGGLVTVAENRGDSLVIIDPDAADADVAAVKDTATALGNLGGYAAYYAPLLKMSDPAKSGPGAIRDTYPGGAVAGVIVRTEAQRTAAKAPAGYSAEIRGALGTSIPISNNDIGELYAHSPHVNSFKSVPGAGVVVYGARTMARTSPAKYIPIRRSLNYIKHNLKEITEFAVFQPNDPNLWSRVTTVVSNFLADYYRKGGLKGDTANQAFFVRCDATNNTVASQEQGIVNVEVGVALQYPAEFVVINVAQWSGGSNAVDGL